MDEYKKKELIETIAHSLDITPDMYDRANSVVLGLKSYLENSSKGVVIYTQGSIKLGTIIKPYRKDRNSDYDIDLVIQYPEKKNEVTAQEIKKRLGDDLKCQNYGRFLDEDEGRRCWTLYYPYKDSNVNFHIDLLPCVDEEIQKKSELKPDEYSPTAISITNIKNKEEHPYKYDWQSSNPEGYAKWFQEINQRKYAAIKRNDKKRIYESNRSLFSSVESVAEDYTRSPLQMVIQLLKRHRDVMYANKEISDYKPISIIITTLVGKIVEENRITENNTYKLLNQILEGLEYYASLQMPGMTSDFSEEFKTKNLITKRMSNGMVYWRISNPADTADNLANRWNENSKYVTEFFRWVKQAHSDLIGILDLSPSDIIAKIKNCLGEEVAEALKNFVFTEFSKPRPVPLQGAKPQPYLHEE